MGDDSAVLQTNPYESVPVGLRAGAPEKKAGASPQIGNIHSKWTITFQYSPIETALLAISVKVVAVYRRGGAS